MSQKPSTGKTFILDILIPTDDSLKSGKLDRKSKLKGGPIFVVSRQGLIALKSLRNTEQDKADINWGGEKEVPTGSKT
ncbi:MAG: hypothetical protein DRR08_21245 [Candidatus Parabeggiatoa sp. nov. 2]|nr:MAG: hypothetical protein B6247_12330 [Beggiatoa sp. 4572_84]RKZ56617.1 MAG: hypothetical protein DRR08_21245 [Gammaproteobacteria bacterium]